MAWSNGDSDITMTMPLLRLDNDVIVSADMQVKASSETSSPGSMRIASGGQVSEAASFRVALAGEITEAASVRVSTT